MHTIRTAAHTAHLDPMTGEGLLVLPNPREDVPDPFSSLGACATADSVHAADWDQMVRALDGLGWEPTQDEDGGWLDAGRTRDGRPIIGLYGRDPITADPTLAEVASASAALFARVSA